MIECVHCGEPCAAVDDTWYHLGSPDLEPGDRMVSAYEKDVDHRASPPDDHPD